MVVYYQERRILTYICTYIHIYVWFEFAYLVWILTCEYAVIYEYVCIHIRGVYQKFAELATLKSFFKIPEKSSHSQYKSVEMKTRKRERRKNKEFRRYFFLHPNNAPAHIAEIKIVSGIEEIPPAPHSPDLAPCALKKKIVGKRSLTATRT